MGNVPRDTEAARQNWTRRAEKGLAAEQEQLHAIFTAIRRASSRYLAVTCNLQPN
jgi:hypothetical protein